MNVLDQLTYFNALSDQSHRFWAYFQVVSLALLGLIWSEHWVENQKHFILIVYTIFALFNASLIYKKQQELVLVWQAIKNIEQLSNVERAFIDTKKRNEPWSAQFVGGMQFAIICVMMVCIYHGNN